MELESTTEPQQTTEPPEKKPEQPATTTGGKDKVRQRIGRDLRSMDYKGGGDYLSPDGEHALSPSRLSVLDKEKKEKEKKVEGKVDEPKPVTPGVEMGQDSPVLRAGRWVRAAQAILGSKQSDKLKDQREKQKDVGEVQKDILGAATPTDPLGFFLGLSQEAESARQAAVGGLDSGGLFSRMLERAGYPNLWKSAEIAQSVVDLMKLRAPALAIEDIDHLLGWKIWDWTVDRYEARLAWELLQTLPAAMQQAILNGVPIEVADPAHAGKTKKIDTKGLQDKLQTAQTNMSQEYKQSTRYDTYDGDKEQEQETQKGEGTDKQSLLEQAADPTLWSDPANAPRLRSVLMMVVQAEQSAAVKDEVKTHWAVHQPMLSAMGFHEDGTWKQVIEDKTASTGWDRFCAGARSIWNVLGAAIGTLVGSGPQTVELSKDLEEAFIRGNTGLDINNLKTDEERGRLLKLLFGKDLDLALVTEKTGWDLKKILELVAKGPDAGIEALKAMRPVGKEGADDEKQTPTAVINNDKKTGITSLSIPLLPANGEAKIFGTTTLKLGPSALMGVDLKIKTATGKDASRFIDIAIGQAILTDLMVVQPQSMLTIQRIALKGLHVNIQLADDLKPETYLSRLLSDIQGAVFEILKLLPSMGSVVLMDQTMKDAIKAADVKDGKAGAVVQQMQFAFDSFEMGGLATSGGQHVDSLAIGKTDLTIDPMAMDGAWKDVGALSAQVDRLQGERKVLEDSKDAKNPENEKKLQGILSQIGRLRSLIRLHYSLAPLQKELDELGPKIEKARKDAGAKPTPEQQKALADMDQRRADLVYTIKKVEASTMTVEGSLGSVDVKGVQAAGTTVASAHMGETTFKKAVGGFGFTAKTTQITADSVTKGDSKRRDTVLKEKIEQAQKAKQAKEEQNAKVTDEKQKESTEAEDKTIAECQAELDALKPITDEYDALRARLTDRAKPLSLDEKKRMAELHKQLHPAGVEIDKLSLEGVNGSVRPGEDGMEAGVTVDKAHAEGLRQNDVRTNVPDDQKQSNSVDQLDMEGGDLSFLQGASKTQVKANLIKSLTLAGVKVAGGNSVGSLSITNGTLDYTQGKAGQIAKATAENITVKDIKIGSTRTDLIEIKGGVIDFTGGASMAATMNAKSVRVAGFREGNLDLGALDMTTGLVGFTGKTTDAVIRVKAGEMKLTDMKLLSSDLCINGTFSGVDSDIGIVQKPDPKDPTKKIMTIRISGHETKEKQEDGTEKVVSTSKMAEKGDLTISGIQNPKNKMQASLTDLGGELTVENQKKITAKNLGVGKVSLSSIDWQAGALALHGKDVTELTDVSVDAAFELQKVQEGGVEKDRIAGKINSLNIGSFKTGGISVKFGDIEASLGKASIGKSPTDKPGTFAAGAGITLTNFDLLNNSWDALSVNDLNATDLSVKVGKDINAKAKSIHAGSLTVSALVTDAAQQKGGEGAKANQYTVSASDMSASQLSLQMKSAGIDLTVTKMTDLDVGKLVYDKDTQAMTFEGIALQDMTIGNLAWSSTSVDEKTKDPTFTGLKLQNASLTNLRATGSKSGDDILVSSLDVAIIKGKKIVFDQSTDYKKPKEGEEDSQALSGALKDVTLTNVKVRNLKLHKGQLVSVSASMKAAQGSIDGSSNTQVFGKALSDFLWAGSSFKAEGIQYDQYVQKDGTTVKESGVDKLKLSNIGLDLRMSDGSRVTGGLPGVTASGVSLMQKSKKDKAKGTETSSTEADIDYVILDQAAKLNYFPATEKTTPAKTKGPDDGWVDKLIHEILRHLNGSITLSLDVDPKYLVMAGLISPAAALAGKKVTDMDFKVGITEGQPDGILGKILSVIIASYKTIPAVKEVASEGWDVVKSAGNTFIQGIKFLFNHKDPAAFKSLVDANLKMKQEAGEFMDKGREAVSTFTTSYKDKSLPQLYDVMKGDGKGTDDNSKQSGSPTAWTEHLKWLDKLNLNLWTSPFKVDCGTPDGVLKHRIAAERIGVKGENLTSMPGVSASLDTSVDLKNVSYGTTTVSQEGGQKTTTSTDFGFAQLDLDKLRATFQGVTEGGKTRPVITGNFMQNTRIDGLHFSNSKLVERAGASK